MKLKKAIVAVVKTLITVGIFVSLFVEFGGGKVAVSRSGFADGSIFYHANPARPGLVGRLKARLTGTPLPEPYVPLAAESVCVVAIEGGQVFVRTESGEIVKFRALHHCVDGKLTQVLASADSPDKVPLAETTGSTVWVEKQGFQRVPMTVGDLWADLKRRGYSLTRPAERLRRIVKSS